MKSLFLFFCLAQLWSCQAVPFGSKLGYRQPNCDDPETEEVAQAAINHLNKNIFQGYKMALNQIDEVKVWPLTPVGEMYEIEIDTLETTCHALDPTPLANCSVRQLREHAVEGDCDFQVLKQNGQFIVQFAKCHSSPDSAEDVLKVCPNCYLLTPKNDTKVVHAVDLALKTFNAQSNNSYYKLAEVSRAQLLFLPPSTYVEFIVAATDCSAKEATNPANCNFLEKVSDNDTKVVHAVDLALKTFNAQSNNSYYKLAEVSRAQLLEQQVNFCKATVFEKVDGEHIELVCTLFQTPHQADAPNVGVPPPAGDLAAPSAAPALGAWLVHYKRTGGPPVHQAHYDLRHTFAGAPPQGSGSFETLDLKRKPKPGISVPGSSVVRPCPGRIRHFKI